MVATLAAATGYPEPRRSPPLVFDVVRGEVVPRTFWAQSEWGERNHAVIGDPGVALCGLTPRQWFTPYGDAEPCSRCAGAYGANFPPPPGREHRCVTSG